MCFLRFSGSLTYDLFCYSPPSTRERIQHVISNRGNFEGKFPSIQIPVIYMVHFDSNTTDSSRMCENILVSTPDWSEYLVSLQMLKERFWNTWNNSDYLTRPAVSKEEIISWARRSWYIWLDQDILTSNYSKHLMRSKISERGKIIEPIST